MTESPAILPLVAFALRAAPACDIRRLAAEVGEPAATAGLATRAMAAVVERADTALVEMGCLTMLLAAAAVMTGVGECAAAEADTGAGDALDAFEVRPLLGG